MRLKILALAIGFLMLSTPSFANLADVAYEDKSRQAALDTPSGQYNAGVSLMRIMNNHKAAAKWFCKAAKQGHAKAQVVLGSMYAVGLGVELDHVLAYVWVDTSLPNLEGKMLDRGSALFEELVSKMSAEDINEAQEIIDMWKTQDMDR